MIRVGIETATPLGSVAVARDDRVLAEVVMGVQTRHAERTLPALETALELAGLERSRVEEVVVGAGPGSFTGVRVAGATAKGLAASLDTPLRAYSSLLALAAGTPADGPVCALFDARRGEVYGGCWRVTADGVEEWLAPRVGPAGEVLAAVRAAAPARADTARTDTPRTDTAPADTAAAAGAEPLFVGDGARAYRSALEAAGARVASTPASPRAAALLWLAHHHPALGAVDDARAWEPMYVRLSSAERGVPG